ncbi:MAG: ParB/RepB/Spo0J family partition protein, partial [Anaerolineales bacterium]|nr:ParB/RepB/Spo0J family partition protein [Anaerolineales bacterium]
LGKGLEALIPTGQTPLGDGGVTQVSVGMIAQNPRQPRVNFDETGLAELAASIREHGVIQPLVVTPVNSEGKHVLIVGERRLEAARSIGLQSVPVIIRHASDQQTLELALIENIQREDLNPLEEADAYRQLIDDFDLSHEEIALQVGKSRVSVTNTLRLLNLPESVKQALLDGRITEGHARALLGLPAREAQEAALQTVIIRELNVRQTEELVRKLSGQKPPAKQKFIPPPEIVDLEQRLRDSLGTKVILRHGKKGGSVTIHYYSDEELDTLLGRLLNE